MDVVMRYMKFGRKMAQNYPVLFSNNDAMDKVHKHIIDINYILLKSIPHSITRNNMIRILAYEYLRYNELDVAWWSL